jgi:hypothetical protein
MMVVTNQRAKEGMGLIGIDAARFQNPSEKARCLSNDEVKRVAHGVLLQDPDTRIVLDMASSGVPLRNFASALSGCSAGDGPRFIRFFWEIPFVSDDWEFHQSTVSDVTHYGGKSEIIYWERERGAMFHLAQSVKHLNHAAQNWLRGKPNWGKAGVVISQMRELPATLYLGDRYDCNCCAVIPNDPSLLPALWAYCSSVEYNAEVRKLNQKLNVTPGTLLDVPFDVDYWRRVAAERFPQGLPEPFSSDPTQWLFNGSPKESDQPLHTAVARLLGYGWPRQTGSSFDGCVDAEGDESEVHSDKDGIVCLTALKGEPPAEQRLNALLAHAFKGDWSASKLSDLLAEVGYAGKSLDDWLRDGFSGQHQDLFQQRPFIWHIWDGRRDGFHALVNYHRLAAPNGEGRRTLEKLIYSYLGDWIDRQRADQTAGVEGADARLAHAEHLKAELIKILEGEPPYDIFVRWKPLHEQAIGWDPDINDGVRMNIRPFMAARTLNARGANACILRATPKIKWDKDRGKEPTRDNADYPWFWGWDDKTEDFVGGAEFDGNRWNDLHYTRAVKQAARLRRKGS